jgi:hypothetical protein
MSAPAPQTTAVSLDQITLDDRVWPREQLDSERVELFMELIRDVRESALTGQNWTDPLPPLVTVADGQGGYIVADGRHRYEARRRLRADFDVVPVYVFQPDGRTSIDRAYELALSFATVSAKPLTTAEKRAAIQRLITDRPELSGREVARLVEVSHSTVNEHRRRVDDSSTDADSVSREQPGTGREPLRWEVAARRLAKDTAELLGSCRKLFGGPNFKSAGRELYDALAALYGDEDALAVIDELGAVANSAHDRARKVSRAG